MKKYILLLLLLIISISSVNAKENKLYFTESDDRLYYDSSLMDKDTFMKHIDMTPGDSYTDKLLIENGTNVKYTLYFKVLPKEQSTYADELLENITMKIIIDGDVLYDGKATGLNYENENLNLRNAILLGEFSPSRSSDMIVETKLLESYSNSENSDELSYIDWSFYAQYEEAPPVQIIEAPNTFKSTSYIPIIISSVVIILGCGVIVYAHRLKKI